MISRRDFLRGRPKGYDQDVINDSESEANCLVQVSNEFIKTFIYFSSRPYPPQRHSPTQTIRLCTWIHQVEIPVIDFGSGFPE